MADRRKKLLLFSSVFAAATLSAFNKIDYKQPETTEVSGVYRNADGSETPFKMRLGEPRVIVRGMPFEKNRWGAYQFPRPYNLGDRLLVAVHVSKDDIKSFGAPNRWFESRDNGKTWREMDAARNAEVEQFVRFQRGNGKHCCGGGIAFASWPFIVGVACRFGGAFGF